MSIARSCLVASLLPFPFRLVVNLYALRRKPRREPMTRGPTFGSTLERDEYARWVNSRGYKHEITALLISHAAPDYAAYQTASLIVAAVSGFSTSS